MKKRTRRAHVLVPTYTRLDILYASSTAPMPAAFRTHQLTRMHGGLLALETAPAPSHDDWRVVADAVNLMESIVAEGWAEDTQGLLQDAVDALGEAGARSYTGAPIRLGGASLRAVRAVLEDYEFCLNNLSERNMKYAHAATEKRIWGIQHGRGRAHDMQVVAL